IPILRADIDIPSYCWLSAPASHPHSLLGSNSHPHSSPQEVARTASMGGRSSGDTCDRESDSSGGGSEEEKKGEEAREKVGKEKQGKEEGGERAGEEKEGEEEGEEEGEKEGDPVVNAWFGPAGTVTPLHHDPCHNLFAQVVGSKYVRVYSSREDERLYPHKEKMLCNSSQVRRGF
ncbi:unnamed protein product, partial [Closterium sp. NIES-53]